MLEVVVPFLAFPLGVSSHVFLFRAVIGFLPGGGTTRRSDSGTLRECMWHTAKWRGTCPWTTPTQAHLRSHITNLQFVQAHRRDGRSSSYSASLGEDDRGIRCLVRHDSETRSISSMHTYSSWSGVGTLAPALVQHSCVEVWSPRHDFGSVLLSVRLQSRHRGYSAPGSGACIMHTTSTVPCSSSL